MEIGSTNDKTSRKNELGEFLREWLKFSKTHGLDRLVLSKKLPLRVIWLLSLLVSTGLCSFLIVHIISDYLRYEVKSRIREVYAEQIPFPTVSVCNYNPLMTPAANAYISDYFRSKYNVSVRKYADFYSHGLEPDDELQYLFYATNDPDLNATLKQSFGFNFLLSCTFYKDLCQPEDMIYYYDNQYGNCLLINSKKYANGSDRQPYQSYLQYSSLVLFLFTGLPDTIMDYLYYPTNGQKGMFIRIEDFNYDGIRLNGVGISAGNQAEVVLTRMDTHNMPEPYSKCVPADLIDTNASRVMKQVGIVNYNRKSCVYVCLQYNIVNKVGCNSMEYPIISEYPLCKTKDEYDQINSVFLNFSLCNDLCPIECDSVTYGISVSYTTWPTYDSYYWANVHGILEKFLNDSHQNITYETTTQSFASIAIYFKEIKYTEIVESPSMTFVDLIAAIGGMMGLFLGFSIMIFVELIELAVETIYIVLKNKINNRQANLVQVRPKI